MTWVVCRTNGNFPELPILEAVWDRKGRHPLYCLICYYYRLGLIFEKDKQNEFAGIFFNVCYKISGFARHEQKCVRDIPGAVMVVGLLVQAYGIDLNRYLLVRDAASHRPK